MFTNVYSPEYKCMEVNIYCPTEARYIALQ